MSLNITEVRVNPFQSTSKARAMASITIDGAFVVSGFTVIEGRDGLFIGMPSKKDNSKDKYNDIAFFLDKAVKQQVQDMIVKAYHEKTGTQTKENGRQSSVPKGYEDEKKDDNGGGMNWIN